MIRSGFLKRASSSGAGIYCDIERKITVSRGLLINSKQNIAVERVYELADKLLYQAKNSG